MTMAALKEITDVLETYSGDQYVFHTGIDEKGNSFWEVEFFFNSEADKYNYLDGNNRQMTFQHMIDPSPAIHLWNVSKRLVRRPEQTPYGPRLQVEDEKEHLDPFLELDPDYLEKQEMLID